METSGLMSPSPRDTKRSSAEAAKTLAIQQLTSKPNQVGSVMLYGVPIVSLVIDSAERLCLAQISNTLLKQFSYNEIHNRRVALGITCVQCTPVQLEILRRAGAMPVSSRRCGMITRREAERLCKSFLGDNAPPRLPDDFAFSVHHECAWGCRGAFMPARYNSSRAKCIKCSYCGLFFSPNKFIFHSHRVGPNDKYVQPDAANFNSWRRHMKLSGTPPDEIIHAWEDVKAMFNGGTRKRMLSNGSRRDDAKRSPPVISAADTIAFPAARRPSLPTPRVPAFPEVNFPRSLVVDYVWQSSGFTPYAIPWLKRGLWDEAGAFRPPIAMPLRSPSSGSDDEPVDVETTEEEVVAKRPWEGEQRRCERDCNSPCCPEGVVPKQERIDIDSESTVDVANAEPASPPPLKHGIRAITEKSSSPATDRSPIKEFWPLRIYPSFVPQDNESCKDCLKPPKTSHIT